MNPGSGWSGPFCPPEPGSRPKPGSPPNRLVSQPRGRVGKARLRPVRFQPGGVAGFSPDRTLIRGRSEPVWARTLARATGCSRPSPAPRGAGPFLVPCFGRFMAGSCSRRLARWLFLPARSWAQTGRWNVRACIVAGLGPTSSSGLSALLEVATTLPISAGPRPVPLLRSGLSASRSLVFHALRNG